MPVAIRNPVRRVREFLVGHELETLSDADLLARFTATRDEDAFSTLVRRHTPLVLGTARRVLHNSSDADDVFQAAFFTLSRKASSLRCERTLVGWLHRVTFRLAMRARKRSRKPCVQVPRQVSDDPLDCISGRELCSAIDEELARLTEPFRAAIVLCCLQGMTRDEAAIELGWSPTTLKRRLARARAILERRLTARGVSLAAALSPALLTTPVSASRQTVADAVEAALGRTAMSPRVEALCSGTVGVLASRFACITASGLVAVGMVVGFSFVKPASPLEQVPISAPKAETRIEMELPADPLPPGAVVRIGTTRFRHDDWVHEAAWAPDGKYIASGAGKTLIIWEASTGREVHRQILKEEPTKRQPWPLPIEQVSWSRDGKSLLTVFDGSMQHWAWDPLKPALEFVQGYKNGGNQRFVAARCGADGSQAISATSTFIQLTDLSKKNAAIQIPMKAGNELRHFVVSPDGKTGVASWSGDRDEFCLFDLQKERTPLVTVSGRNVMAMAFSGNGKKFAVAFRSGDVNTFIELWDTAKWEKPHRIEYPKTGDLDTGIRAIALSPDGKTLITGGEDKTLRWWDAATGKELRKAKPGWVYFNKAAFRPDGRVLMTTSHENHIRLWDVETGKELSTTVGPGWTMAGAAWTPDGKLVLSVSENIVFAHNTATGQEIWRGGEHTDTAVQIVITPDGKTAISSGNDGQVIFREVETGAVIRALANPRHSADRIALSADGQTLIATGCEQPHDGVILRWDVRSGRQ